MLYGGTDFQYYHDNGMNRNRNKGNVNDRTEKRTVSSMKKGLSTVYNVQYSQKDDRINRDKEKIRQNGK